MYLLYTTPTSLVIKKEDSDKFLTIDRSDNGNIELKPASEISSLNLSSHHRILYCILGIVRIAGDSYLVVATQATNVATIDGAHILKIIETDFISYRTGLGSKFQGKELEETAFYQMQLLLSSGHFYFSSTPSFDITHTLQKQRSTPTQYSKALPIWERADPRFFWNKFIQRDFITNNLEEWCTPTIMGFVETKACSNVGGKLLELVLVSRRSRFRAGTRYNARGVDDDGNVANFVETEQIVTINKCTLSFVQVRGSVPVFWEQLAPQVSKLSDIKFSKISEIGKIATKVSNKIQICRTSQSTTPATQKHFKYTTDLYGQTTCLNLLALSKSGEKLLTDAFEHQLKILNDPSIRYTLFDYNDIIKGSKMDKLDTVIMRIMDAGQIGYYTRDSSNTILRRQNGVIRTNCKDCLDRTNVVQTRIAWRLLDIQLKSLDLLPPHSSLESYTDLSTMFKTVWANNGDDLSIQYAGSGSLKSNLTRTGQSTLMGFIDDGKKSVTRFYMNNFRDSARQEGIDQLLGLHHAVKIASQAEMNIQKLMAARATEYMQTKTIPLFVGTFNVGGEDPGYESLDPWLDPTKHGEVLPDIYAIGIQEVVELTPGKILATDPERGRIWETELRKSLASVSARHGNKSGYILIQSHQLVGLLLCIFVKDTIVESIRDVQYEITKVGLKGMAGNKGGIAVSLLYGNTRMCFVTAHLAAGQSNVEDRNNDYADINENTAFGRQRQIKIVDHTYVFWFGDFNYRIDMPDEEVRKLVSENQLDTLFARDQLQAAIASGHSFQGFKEGALTFQPTYKYDLHTQIYDTSPKSRAPAWTDRVLWKARDKLEQRHYDRVELTLSDHRPVWSYLQVDIKKTDKDKERQLRKLIISSRSPNGADVNSPDIISWDDPSPTPASQTGHSQPAALIDFDFTMPPSQPTATPVPTITGLEDLHITDLRNPFNSNSPGRLSPTPNSNGHAAKKLPPLPPVPTGNSQQIRTSISPRSATIVSSMPVTHPSPNLPQFAATVTPIITPQQQLYQPQPQLQPQPQHPQQRISPTPNPNFASQPMRTSASYNPFMDQTPVQPQFQQQHQQYQQPAYQPDFFSTAQPLLPNSGPNHLMNKPIVPYGVQPAQQQSKISEDDFFNQMMGAPGTSTLKPTPTNQMMNQRTTPSNNANPNLFDPFA